MFVQFKKLSENAITPSKNDINDSGFDLYSAEDATIRPGETVVIKTDIAIGLDEGYEAQVRPRSGITSKTKLRIILGTIDNPYRGGICVIVDNIDVVNRDGSSFRNIDGSLRFPEHDIQYETSSYVIRKGDKIAQLVIQHLPNVILEEVDTLDDTVRGTKGFGSTGY